MLMVGGGCIRRVLDAVHHKEVRGQDKRLRLLAAEAPIEGQSVSVDYCCRLSGFGLRLKEELDCLMPGSDDVMTTVSPCKFPALSWSRDESRFSTLHQFAVEAGQ